MNFDLAIVSPLKRIRETFDVINGEPNISVIYDERIIERDFGEFEGKTASDFDFEDFWNYYSNNKYERAENIQDCFN